MGWIVLWAVLLIVVMILCWATNAFGLPGNWFALAAAIVYALLVPEGRADFGWPALAAMTALAVVGEVIELVAGAHGAAKEGGSKRGAALALLGSIIGGLSGIFFGLPIPIVGSLVAGMLFAALGALGGAMLGEAWKGRSTEDSWRIGQAAFWGRLIGTIAKIIIGAFMIVIAVVALFW